MVARQVHRGIEVGHNLRHLNILRQVDEDWARTACCSNVKRLSHHAGDVVGIGHKIVVLGDTATDFNDRRLLKRIGADHAGADLARNRNHRHAVHPRVSDRRHEVECARATGSHAHARLPRCAGVALGGKAASLLVPRQNRAEPIGIASEGLMQWHAGPAWIGKYHIHSVPNQRLNHDIGPVERRFRGSGAGDCGHGWAPGRES